MPFMEITTDPLPANKGTYLLILLVRGHRSIQVGRLGLIGFEPGWYAYAGSAFGPGGLAGRLRHHLGAVRKPHWHIDYLRAEATMREVWVSEGEPCREHDWAAVLAKGRLAGTGVRGFGCSDCRCASHLIYFDHRPDKACIREQLGPGTLRLPLTTGPARLQVKPQ
jgi:Uri superfamily endonuclease